MNNALAKQLDSSDPRDRAKAIKSLAISGNASNLQVLESLQTNDPDPRLREYAQKAADHLQYLLDAAANPESGLETQKFAEAAAARLREKPDQGGISRADRERAEKAVQRAFNLHASGQTKKAIKVFKKALEIHPGLEEQTFAANLAMELTGLPFKEAFDSILGR